MDIVEIGDVNWIEVAQDWVHLQISCVDGGVKPFWFHNSKQFSDCGLLGCDTV
jgi:hypothetical protein